MWGKIVGNCGGQKFADFLRLNIFKEKIFVLA